ncbi:MAG: hypothetical protein ACAI34_03095 [Verrucomicrobium sp.]|nr:hypothetical protein [Verrucomicrobium sp.]
MRATRIYTGEDDLTHFEDFEVPLKDGGPIGRLSELSPGSGIIFRETDATYDYDWHPAPRKQWLILLDGLVVIEAGDGTVRQFSGGDIMLLEDTTGRGHRTRQLSAGVRRSVFIPIPTDSDL